MVPRRKAANQESPSPTPPDARLSSTRQNTVISLSWGDRLGSREAREGVGTRGQQCRQSSRNPPEARLCAHAEQGPRKPGKEQTAPRVHARLGTLKCQSPRMKRPRGHRAFYGDQRPRVRCELSLRV